MPNSYVIYTGDNATTQRVVTFPFISRSHVTVSLDGVPTSSWTWINDGLISISPAPGTGVKIRIERNSSPNQRLVNFQNSSQLDEADLDLDGTQAFYLAQEAEDRAQESIAPASDTNWDAGNKRIKNVATPVDANDAATRQYVIDQTAASVTAAANSANTATTQAGIATTQAGIATTQANNADAARIAAENARNDAQAAAATLPVASVGNADRWLKINVPGDGWSYRSNVELLGDIGAVPVARTISPGSGLTGGGDLSANRTLTVDSTVVALLAGVQAFTGAKRYVPATLTDQATISWDLDAGPIARVTLAGNRTVGAPTNQRDGGTFILIVNQDGSGNRTLAWNAAFDFGAEGTPVLPTGANRVAIFTFISNGTSMRCIGRWNN